MKKILLILALALGVLPMAAESATIQGAKQTTEAGLPVDLGYVYSASQSIYTPADLAALPDGVDQVADINSITAHLNIPGATWLWNDYDFSITLYVKEIDETAFAQDASKAYIPLDFANAASATFTMTDDLLYEDEFWYDAACGGEDLCPINFEFDSPVRYSGKSLLLTWVCRIVADDVTASMGDPAFNPGRGVVTLKWGNSKNELTPDDMAQPVSGNLQKCDYLPILDIDYTAVNIEHGPTIVEGTPADAFVGPFGNGVMGDDNGGYITPVDFSNSYMFSQSIYPASELEKAGLNQEIDGCHTTSAISEITFQLFADDAAMWDYFNGDYKIQLFVENIDADGFPNNGKDWFAYSKEYSGTLEDSYEMFCPGEYEESVLSFTVKLDNPIRYEGHNLLLTWVYEGSVESFSGAIFHSQLYTPSGTGNLSAGKVSQTTPLSDLTGSNSATTRNLPVLKLHYTPLIEKGGEAKNVVSFGNVEPLLMTANVDPALASSSLTGINDIKKLSAANYIALAYTIDDANASADKSYEIQLDNKSLGTVTGTSGVIKYINPVPVGDLYLKVVPSDAQSVGKATTVEKATVENLLPQPEVSVVKSQYYITAHDTDPLKANIHAAVKFHFATAEGAVASVSVSSDSSNPQRKLLHDGSANSSVEFDSEFLSLDAENWNQLHLNNNSVSFYYPSVLTAEYVDGQLVVPSRGFSSGIKASVSYPTVSLAQPTLTEGTQAELFAMNYDIDASNAQQFTYKAVSKSPADESYNGVKFTIEPPRSEDLSGVESVVVDADGEVEYFNLQGVRVAEPTAGMYIRRQGNTVAKVLVK